MTLSQTSLGQGQWSRSPVTKTGFSADISDEFEGQGHQGQKTAFFSPFSGLHAVYDW